METTTSQAQYIFESGHGQRGLHLLRTGLARSPKNREGRILLARIYAENHRPDLAKQILQSGLRYHQHDSEYLAALLRFLIEEEDDHLALQLSNQLLQTPSTPPKIIAFAAQSAATLHYRKGDYDTSEVLLDTHEASKTHDGRLLLAQIEWERGYRSLALLLLRELRNDYPASERIYDRLQESLRSENLTDESRRLALIHQLTHPDRLGSHLDRIRSLQVDGDERGVVHAADSMLNTFARQPTPLLALGDFAATTGLVSICRTLQKHFQQNNLPDRDIINLLLIEALLNAKQYHEVLKETAQLDDNPDFDQAVSTAKGLTAIAHYGLGDTGSGYAQLTVFMAQPQLRPASLLAIADRLASMGHRTPAQEILDHAQQLAPQSQPILTRLLKLSLEERDITSLSKNLRLFLTMRRPSPAILTDALNLLHGCISCAVSVPRKLEKVDVAWRLRSTQPMR